MVSEEADNKKVHCLTIYRFAEDTAVVILGCCLLASNRKEIVS